MNTDTIIEEATTAADRARRYHRLEQIVVRWFIVFLVLFAAFAFVALSRQNEIRKVAHRQECIARLTAAALAADPATPERTLATDNLMHLDRECPD